MNSSVRRFRDWLNKRGHSVDLMKIPPNEMNQLVGGWILDLKKEDGQEYEPNSNTLTSFHAPFGRTIESVSVAIPPCTEPSSKSAFNPWVSNISSTMAAAGQKAIHYSGTFTGAVFNGNVTIVNKYNIHMDQLSAVPTLPITCGMTEPPEDVD